MKVAILNDTHAGVRNSSDIFINYQERFYSEVFFPYLKENNITQILHLGDYYEHRKYINFKALNANRKHFLDKLKLNGLHMDIIPGNHDVFYKNTNELCSLKELLGYYTGNVNIIMNPTVLKYGKTSVAALPWINSENYSKSIEFVNNCKATILAGHLELVGFEMMKGVINAHGMDTTNFKRFDKVISGHFHTKSSIDNIHYLGSQMEFTWADAHDPKYFHILDTDTDIIEKVLNPITMFEKVVYNDEELCYDDYDFTKLDDKFVKVFVVKKKDPYFFDKFIDKIQDRDIHELKIAESFDEFLGENVDDEGVLVEDTTELLDSYVDGVETELDKPRIKHLMQSLLVEAQSMDIL
jgi:DNA repair exonuclease SbcCD nuclease subunit